MSIERILLLVAAFVVFISVVPALLNASNNAAVLVGVLIVVGAVMLVVKHVDKIIKFLGFERE